MKTVALMFLAPALLRAQEVSIKVSDLPSEIRSAVSARFPGAPMVEAARETEDGKTFYEVTIKLNGKKVDVTASTAGQLTLIEREIAKKDLPATVVKLVDDKYPKAKYNTVEDVTTISATGEKLSYYEVLITVNKERLELQLALDGSSILKAERKKPGDVN
jgi:hypothetical protein